MWNSIVEVLRAVFEIIVMATVLYACIRVLRGSRGMNMLMSVFGIVAFMLLGTKYFHLRVLEVILKGILSFMPVFLIVVFQAEIRRVLSMINFTRLKVTREKKLQESIGESKWTNVLLPILKRLSLSRTGALIAIQQEVGLKAICESGRMLNAPLKADNMLLETIFYDGSPLHDGGVVIAGDMVVAAGCEFPLCDGNPALPGHWGMRHRAALGLSEQSDAVVLVVSEETGRVSLAFEGKIVEIGSDMGKIREALGLKLANSEGIEDTTVVTELLEMMSSMGRQIRLGLGLSKGRKSRNETR